MKIAFGCQSRVGKDEACSYLQKNYGGTILHFSDPLYKILHYAQDICHFEKKKDRQFLQYIGTEWARNQDSNVWVKLLMKNIDDVKILNSNVYVGDVRFKNEFQTLKNKGFLCVLIINPNRVMEVETEVQTHISENDAFTCNWDDVIVNNGTLQEFHSKLEQMIANNNLIK